MKFERAVIPISVALLAVSIPGVVWAKPALQSAKHAPHQPLTGREIAYRSEHRPDYKADECTSLEMQLINAQGQIRRRDLVRYQKKFPSGKKTLVKFWYPNDIKDSGTLNEEVKNADDLQHLYLPAINKTKRVSTKSQSWMGSDFNYEDIMELKFDNFDYKLVKTDVFDGRECYVYSMVPKSPGDSIYARELRWVAKKDYLPTRTEYYDNQGKLIKYVEFTDMRPVQGITYAFRIYAKSLSDGHQTVLTRQWIRLDSGVDDEYLTVRNLEKSVDLYAHPKDLRHLLVADSR